MTTVNFIADQFAQVYYDEVSGGILDWNAFHNYSGTAKLGLHLGNSTFGLGTSPDPPKGYAGMQRCFFRVPVSSIPSGAFITSAILHYKTGDTIFQFPTGSPKISIGFYNYSASIGVADYYACMTSTLTTKDNTDTTWQTVTIDPTLVQNGSMEFVYRDGYFDYLNNTPSTGGQWTDLQSLNIIGADQPYLEVTYSL